MPRPKPAPEDTTVRATISLPQKVYDTAMRYRFLHPEENIRDFSGMVATAIIEYAERHHPGLYAKMVDEIRGRKGEYPQIEPKATRAAESPAGVRIKQNPTLNESKTSQAKQRGGKKA